MPANYSDLAARALDGGFTYDPKRGVFPDRGFAVGIFKGLEQRVPLIDFDHRSLAAFVDKNAQPLLVPGACLGCWLDAGVVFIDVSVVVPTFEQAVELAKQHDQLAFFNLETFETVRLEALAA